MNPGVRRGSGMPVIILSLCFTLICISTISFTASVHLDEMRNAG